MPSRTRKYPLSKYVLWVVGIVLLFFTVLPSQAEEEPSEEPAAAPKVDIQALIAKAVSK